MIFKVVVKVLFLKVILVVIFFTLRRLDNKSLGVSGASED